MHTIKLNIQDSIYNHIMFLLKNLNNNSNDIEIIEDKIIKKESKDNIDLRFNAISIDTRGFKFNREEANAR